MEEGRETARMVVAFLKDKAALASGYVGWGGALCEHMRPRISSTSLPPSLSSLLKN